MTAPQTARTLLALLLMAATMLGHATAADADKRRKKSRTQTATEQSAVAQPLTAQPAPEPEPEQPAEPVPAPEPKPVRMARTPREIDSIAAHWKAFHTKVVYDEFFERYMTFARCDTPAPPDKLDSVYAERLRAIISPIPMPYNHLVRQAIDRYTQQRTSMTRILSYARYYFPMIEEELLRAGLPVELRAMAIIESALQPKAVSRMGAAGLWQFMPTTGRHYGLEVNSMVDERYDPLLATRAACRYLKTMYDAYGDWLLAIAAYNCGQGRVNAAIQRAGGREASFWHIYEYLPPETRGYVPAFIGATYAYAYHRAHGITFEDPPMPIAVDTVMINRPTHFEQISSTIDISLEALRMLNPQYKLDIVPATTREYALVIPADRYCDFKSGEQTIMAKDSIYMKEYISPANIDKRLAQAPAAKYHTVKKGETLGAIARKYRVSQKQLITWNKLKSPDRLSIGQRLRVGK